MDHAGDKQHWNQRCQPSANLSLGSSEEVAEWTDGSELLALVQHFNSTRFLHERNLEITPALISWQKVLVIFGNASLEGVTDGPSFISSDLLPPSSSMCRGLCWRKGTAVTLPQGQVTGMDTGGLAPAGQLAGTAVCVQDPWTATLPKWFEGK